MYTIKKIEDYQTLEQIINQRKNAQHNARLVQIFN